MRNPFTPSFGVTPPVLAGRDDLLENFAEAIDSGVGHPWRCLLLKGLRGSGKTVALNALEDIAHMRDWIVVSTTCRPGFSQELTESLIPFELEKLDSPSLKPHISSLHFSLGGAGGGVELEHSASAVRPSLRIALTQLATLADKNDRGVLLTVDEIHRDAQHDLIIVSQTLQHLFREGHPFIFVAAGLPLSVDGLLHDNVTTFMRRAQKYTLDNIDYDSIVPALRDPINNSGYSITPDALAEAVSATRGYPYLIQSIGFHMLQQTKNIETIDIGVAQRGIEKAIRSIGSLIHEPALQGLSDIDRSYLAAMSQDDGPSSTGDIAHRLRQTPQYAGMYRKRLLDAELIQECGRGKVTFTLPYLRNYLRNHAASTIFNE